jgi:hypothetical protein
MQDKLDGNRCSRHAASDTVLLNNLSGHTEMKNTRALYRRLTQTIDDNSLCPTKTAKLLCAFTDAAYVSIPDAVVRSGINHRDVSLDLLTLAGRALEEGEGKRKCATHSVRCFTHTSGLADSKRKRRAWIGHQKTPQIAL